MLEATLLALMMQAMPPTVSMDQIDTSGEPRDESVDQVSNVEESRRVVGSPIPQGPAPDDAINQISNADPDTQLDTVEGIDSCEGATLSEEEREFCARRLETRSQEFAGQPSQTLTAEEKLLGERLLARTRGDVAAASQRAQGTDVSAEDRDLQALASLTLTPAPPPVATESPAGDLSAETLSLIEAIVEGMTDRGGN